jgi:hypothetical protein
MKLKNIGPCKILRKFGNNAYEIELPRDVEISTIFNVSDLYPYREVERERSKYQEKIQWEKQMPVAENQKMEKIVDQRIGKKTMMKTYIKYLVKWRGHPIEDASWVSEVEYRSMEDQCKRSWTRVHDFSTQRSMMQEHCVGMFLE